MQSVSANNYVQKCTQLDDLIKKVDTHKKERKDFNLSIIKIIWYKFCSYFWIDVFNKSDIESRSLSNDVFLSNEILNDLFDDIENKRKIFKKEQKLCKRKKTAYENKEVNAEEFQKASLAFNKIFGKVEELVKSTNGTKAEIYLDSKNFYNRINGDRLNVERCLEKHNKYLHKIEFNT